MADEKETAGVVAPPPLIHGAGLVAGLLLSAAAPVARVPAPLRAVGALSLLVGSGFIGLSLREMRRARTSVSPYQPTDALVEAGPYRLSRNPIYVGFALIHAGVALLTGAVWALVTLVPAVTVIRFGVIAREERYLRRRLGRPYEEYAARVRRWL